MATKALYLLVVLLAAAVSTMTHAQQIPEVSRQELDKILSTEQGAAAMVDCIVNFQEECDVRLMRIGELVPSLIANKFRCRPPVCSQQTSSNVLFFVRTMQKTYPRLWRKLVTNHGKK